MTARKPERPVAFASATTAYLLFYVFFTGAVQVLQTPSLGIRNTSIIITQVTTQLYTGPLIQIIGEGYLINIRLLSVMLGMAIAGLVGYNAMIIWVLFRNGWLKTCLIGGTGGGVAGLLASIISFGYICCGWPASLTIFGIGLISFISPYLTAAAATLLTANAFILRTRLKTIERKPLTTNKPQP